MPPALEAAVEHVVRNEHTRGDIDLILEAFEDPTQTERLRQLCQDLQWVPLKYAQRLLPEELEALIQGTSIPVSPGYGQPPGPNEKLWQTYAQPLTPCGPVVNRAAQNVSDILAWIDNRNDPRIGCRPGRRRVFSQKQPMCEGPPSDTCKITAQAVIAKCQMWKFELLEASLAQAEDLEMSKVLMRKLLCALTELIRLLAEWRIKQAGP